MKTFANLSDRARRGALAVMMLGVLLGAVALARLTVTQGAQPRPDERWSLTTNAQGEPVGWRVTQRGPGGALGRQGYTIQGQPRGLVHWSRWQLTPDADQGRYVAWTVEEGLGPTITVINYEGQTVIVGRQLAGRGQMKSRPFPVGDNYIPEGTLEPLIARVAGSDETVTGTVVSDQLAALLGLQISPVPQAEAPAVTDAPTELQWARVVWIGPEGPLGADLYAVDAAGEVVLVAQQAGGQVVSLTRRVRPEQVLQHFPRALALRSRALEEDPWK